MTAPRESWTDPRLDDLSKKVDDGFARVDSDIRELRGEMNTRFKAVDKRFDKLDAKIDSKIDKLDAKFDAKFDRLALALIVSALGIIGTLIGTVVLLVR